MKEPRRCVRIPNDPQTPTREDKERLDSHPKGGFASQPIRNAIQGPTSSNLKYSIWSVCCPEAVVENSRAPTMCAIDSLPEPFRNPPRLRADKIVDFSNSPSDETASR